MDCKDCISASIANYKTVVASKNKIIRWLSIIIIIMFVGFVAYAIVDKIIDSQYEYEADDVRVISEDDGDANYIGGNGDISYGKDYSQATD